MGSALFGKGKWNRTGHDCLCPWIWTIADGGHLEWILCTNSGRNHLCSVLGVFTGSITLSGGFIRYYNVCTPFLESHVGTKETGSNSVVMITVKCKLKMIMVKLLSIHLQNVSKAEEHSNCCPLTLHDWQWILMTFSLSHY